MFETQILYIPHWKDFKRTATATEILVLAQRYIEHLKDVLDGVQTYDVKTKRIRAFKMENFKDGVGYELEQLREPSRKRQATEHEMEPEPKKLATSEPATVPDNFKVPELHKAPSFVRQFSERTRP
ncbi:Protein CBG07497 [Caenorhabditis briggsae]|uniref:Protein CBG07497 n=1 Tax=Caenorhabditis briggsae TaxID=6238 RepID=A8X4N5_CAEBR|nr:Protein CBG07497 [Caenorhabditis briggsae]CAP27595.1 Protein CBG07497 [Caenorhabditis briggsae]